MIELVFALKFEQEPSSSEKFTDETNIISNTNERVLIIDEAAKEGSETLLSTIVATEFSETHVEGEAGFELNEGFETGKPAEVNYNLITFIYIYMDFTVIISCS